MGGISCRGHGRGRGRRHRDARHNAGGCRLRLLRRMIGCVVAGRRRLVGLLPHLQHLADEVHGIVGADAAL